MEKWLEEWVFSWEDYDEYLRKLGGDRIVRLRASAVAGYSMIATRGKRPPPKLFTPLPLMMR